MLRVVIYLLGVLAIGVGAPAQEVGSDFGDLERYQIAEVCLAEGVFIGENATTEDESLFNDQDDDDGFDFGSVVIDVAGQTVTFSLVFDEAVEPGLYLNGFVDTWLTGRFDITGLEADSD